MGSLQIRFQYFSSRLDPLLIFADSDDGDDDDDDDEDDDDDIHLSTDGRRSVDNDNGERRNQFEMEFLGKSTPVTSSALEKWLFLKYKKCSKKRRQIQDTCRKGNAGGSSVSHWTISRGVGGAWKEQSIQAVTKQILSQFKYICDRIIYLVTYDI